MTQAAESFIGLALVVGALLVSVTAQPVTHMAPTTKPAKKTLTVQLSHRPTVQPPSQPPANQSREPAAPKTIPKPAPPSTSTQPIPASQPSPGSGVKQLAPASSSSSSASTTNSASGSSTTTANTSPSPASGGYKSTNWSGYAALSGNFTTVSGSWLVPTVSGNGQETVADATWIGIGGVAVSDLIQIGTEDNVSPNGRVSTLAFYELLPDPSLEISSLAVKGGDEMSASIAETSTNLWTINITDKTTGQSYSNSVAYTSSLSSAEWIEEDPSYLNGSLVPFASFDHVVFSSGSTTKNSSPVNISASQAAPITLVDSNNISVVTPSILINSGGGFWALHD